VRSEPQYKKLFLITLVIGILPLKGTAVSDQ